VQSFCFRGFKGADVVARKVKAIGLDRIELCGVHVDFAGEKGFEPAIDAFRQAGVSIISIGVQRFRGDAAGEELFFKFARAAGATTISADFTPESVPDSYRAAEKLADKYDINVAIHNHGGRHWLGSAAMLNAVFNQTSARIGLMLDTAWALDSGEDPLVMIDRFGDRLYGVHVKDFVFDRARKPQDVVVGTGNLRLPDMFATLKAISFAGHTILEYEGDVDNPVPALTECVQAIRKAR
jgi:sugar phosphate isomerase/epimerase